MELAEIIDDDENVSLLVFSRLSTVEGTDSQVSYEDFMEENNADFVIYIVTTKDYDSVEEPLKQLMEKYPDLTGVVEYWDNVSNEILGEFKEMAKDVTTLTGQMQFLLKTDGTCIEFYVRGIIHPLLIKLLHKRQVNPVAKYTIFQYLFL